MPWRPILFAAIHSQTLDGSAVTRSVLRLPGISGRLLFLTFVPRYTSERTAGFPQYFDPAVFLPRPDPRVLSHPSIISLSPTSSRPSTSIIYYL